MAIPDDDIDISDFDGLAELRAVEARTVTLAGKNIWGRKLAPPRDVFSFANQVRPAEEPAEDREEIQMARQTSGQKTGRKPRVDLTPDQWAQICRRARTERLADIAADYDVRASSLRNRCKREGVAFIDGRQPSAGIAPAKAGREAQDVEPPEPDPKPQGPSLKPLPPHLVIGEQVIPIRLRIYISRVEVVYEG